MTPHGRQRRGNGSITLLSALGRYRVRAPDARRSHLGFFDTFEEAQAVLEAARRNMALAGPPVGEITVAGFGAKVLDERERGGYRGVDGERRYFRTHIESSAMGLRPVAAVEQREVREWVKLLERRPAMDRRRGPPRTIATATVQRALAVVSLIFAASVEAGIRETNPCTGVRVRRPANLAATKETWAYLTPQEERLLRDGPIPESEKMIILFALGTGLRQGEQWNLELRDLHVNDDAQGGPHVIVRFGSKGKPPKNGKIRRVPLFGIGLAAARRWLELLPSYVSSKPGEVRSTAGLVFPSPRGCRRPCGKFGRHGHLDHLLRACGVTKHLRWHDLRHHAASALVSGSWGRTWSLHEVSAMLGHSSILVTQRYAHLGETVLTRAAAETGRLQTAPSMSLEEARRLVAEADALAREKAENVIDPSDRKESAAIPPEPAGIGR